MSGITQHFTVPEVRTCIAFTENEVRDALIVQARKEGYQFTGPLARSVQVWFPHDNDTRGKKVTLAFDTEGNTPSVTKPKEAT